MKQKKKGIYSLVPCIVPMSTRGLYGGGGINFDPLPPAISTNNYRVPSVSTTDGDNDSVLRETPYAVATTEGEPSGNSSSSSSSSSSQQEGRSAVRILLIGACIFTIMGTVVAIAYCLWKLHQANLKVLEIAKYQHASSAANSPRFEAIAAGGATPLSKEDDMIQKWRLPPRGDLFYEKTAIGAATHDRPVWNLTRDAAETLATPDDHGELTMAYADDYRRHGSSLIIFIYGGWCGNCQEAAPEVYKAAQMIVRATNYNRTQKVFVMVMNESEVPPSYGAVVKGFPTVLAFDATDTSNQLREMDRTHGNGELSKDIEMFCKRIFTAEQQRSSSSPTTAKITPITTPPGLMDFDQDTLNDLAQLLV